jgi:hypothetical protein
MKRMGFASLMRTVVPGLLAWVFLLPLSAFSATTGGIDPGFLVILQPLVLLLCVFAAFLCVWRENWMFMIPMLLAVIVALAGLFAMAIDA